MTPASRLRVPTHLQEMIRGLRSFPLASQLEKVKPCCERLSTAAR